MNISKLFGFAKKGAKAASKSKGGEAPSKWPSGTKVGLFGHENSGKTVYLTVLNEECKFAKGLQISVTDNATAGEFLSNYRSIWGISSAMQTGTVVDRRGDKKFPDPTIKDRILQFTAIVDRTKKIPIVTYDYNGNAVSISDNSEQSDKALEFMTACNGLLFFFDPKILGAELEIQARASSFVNMLERLAPLKSRIPIPIALVINKSDTLPGFKGESQTILINPEDEQFISEDFETFLEKILSSSKVVADSAWAASVRNVLVRLREFLRVVVGRTLNFQIFFISNTGNEPVKIGADVGRSVYAPPDKINPSGVREPFYWLLKAIVRNKRLTMMRRISKLVTVISLVWIILYSLPFLFHFFWLLPQPIRVEKATLESVGNQHLLTSEKQRTEIMRNYKRYHEKWLVRQFFPGFKAKAGQMVEIYGDFSMGKAEKRLDNLIEQFSKIVKSKSQQPVYNPSKDSLILTDKHTKLISEIESFKVGSETSKLFLRSDRTIIYWGLFTQYLTKRDDVAIAEQINDQIKFDNDNAEEYSSAEKNLGKSLTDFAKIKKAKVEKKVDSEAALTEFKSLKKKINRSTDASYVLGGAVSDLKSTKRKLIKGTHDAQIAEINSYLKKVDKWKKSQTFECKLETAPGDFHLHIEVTANGASPVWADRSQLFESSEFSFKWKTGDDIHIAIEPHSQCTWGVSPAEKIVLTDKYDIFKMEGNLTFPNIGKTITISFKGGLKDRLPKMD